MSINYFYLPKTALLKQFSLPQEWLTETRRLPDMKPHSELLCSLPEFSCS